MLVIGAKGMAKELLEILSQEMGMSDDELMFFDNINKEKDLLYGRFKILKSFEEAKIYFEKYDNRFTLGLGNPSLRSKISSEFSLIGGKLTSIISRSAKIGSYNTSIGNGCQIMQGVVITNDVILGTGVLVNLNSTICHDCNVGDFTEIACGVTIPGRCTIGENVFIGSNATLNPDIKVGYGAIIGSGSVVIKDVEANTIVAGNPAKII